MYGMSDEHIDALLNAGYTISHTKKLGKIRRFVRAFKQGLDDRFPVCCIFRFAVRDALEDGKVHVYKGVRGQAVDRGTAMTKKSKCEFVPCCVFHKTQARWEDE